MFKRYHYVLFNQQHLVEILPNAKAYHKPHQQDSIWDAQGPKGYNQNRSRTIHHVLDHDCHNTVSGTKSTCI